ncbi:hypothetical protein ACEWY4_016648 [Coilia grayii]|uniref:Uncharacterized protein n=1 Tax=Coilia grayii TaxID=363190 RepID=A0ABD1JMD3_9TELE
MEKVRKNLMGNSDVKQYYLYFLKNVKLAQTLIHMDILIFIFQGNKGRALNTPYRLRRRTIPSKLFNDFYLGSQPLSKETPQTVGKMGKKSDEGSAQIISQDPLPVPISSRHTLRCGDNSSALPQCVPRSSPKVKTGCKCISESCGTTLSPVSENSECVARKRKQAKSITKDAKVMSCPKPFGLPTTPQVSPSELHVQVNNNLKERLDIAALLLQMAQHVPKLIPEAGCKINLQQELRRIKEYGGKIQGNTSTKKIENPVKVHCSSGKHGHIHTLESDPKWTAPRDRQTMSFPSLEDSSLMAEAKERKRREVALQKSLRQLAQPVEDDYIKNAAVLPDLRPLPPMATTLPQSCSIPSAAQSTPLLMHGHTPDKYRAIYHSIVDAMRTTKPGNACPYNIGLGRSIKQALWEKLSCPSFEENVNDNGRVTFTETFSSPTLNSFAPNINVDFSEEPLPEEPRKKKARR